MIYFYINKTVYNFKFLPKYKFKCLRICKINQAGRSHLGKIVLYGRGGSKYKRLYRLIDFKRFILYIPGIILHFEYDLNRNCYIMLILYKNGILTYNLGINLLKSRMILFNKYYYTFSYIGYNLSILNCLVGSFINCVKCNTIIAKIARAAGTYVQLVRKFGNLCLLRLPSKEERFIEMRNTVIIGRIAIESFKLLKYSSAGILRRFGFKSKVRGTAKNPIDHPHGGAGRTPTGGCSVSPWGIYTKGIRTTSRFYRFNLLNYGFFKRRTKILF